MARYAPNDLVWSFLFAFIAGLVILVWVSARRLILWARTSESRSGNPQNSGANGSLIPPEPSEPGSDQSSGLRPSERTPLLQGSAASSATAVGSSTSATPIKVGSRVREGDYYPKSHVSSDSSPSPDNPGLGVFYNATNFVMNNAVIVKYDQVASKEAVLKWISEYTISGAEFDSSAREPPPRCHPGTRLQVLELIQSWIHNRQRKQNLMWLSGPAGVGKSAIIQSIAESTAHIGILGATLFFSRINNRNNPKLVFTTLAYQLAVRVPVYRKYLRKKMERDCRMLEKGMKELFELLFVAPLAHLQGSEYQKWIIMLDGLDECQGDREQVEIIHLISNFAARYSSAPLLWIISSRPEPHLKDAFNSKSVKPHRWAYFLPIDSNEACRDVELYLSHEFTRIRKKYPYITPPWPTEEQCMRIARMACGLFVFAVTLAHFVDDPNVGDPVTHLNIILDISTIPIQDPLEALHALYGRILDNVPHHILPTTKLLLGFCLMRGQLVGLEDVDFQLSCNLLGLPHHVAWGALNKLHSVVQVPRPHFADAYGYSFYHASFGDYLRDQWRSGKYAVDVDGVWRHSLQRCLQILTDVSRESSSNYIFSDFPSWPRIDRESNKRLKGKLIQKAWANIVKQLRLMFPLDDDLTAGSKQSFINPHTILSDVPEIDFSRIMSSYLDLDADSTPDEFANWLLLAELPGIARRPGIIERTTLQNLDLTYVDTRKVSLAFHYHDTQVDLTCSGDMISDMLEYFPSPGRVDNHLLSDVARLQAERSSQLEADIPVDDVPVVIIGNRYASKACAIVYSLDDVWNERSLFFLPLR